MFLFYFIVYKRNLIKKFWETIMFKKRREKILQEQKNNQLVIDYINATVKDINSTYKYYPLHSFLSQLNNLILNIQNKSNEILKLFYKEIGLKELETLRTNATIKTNQIKNKLSLLDKINNYNETIFHEKDKFNKHCQQRISFENNILKHQLELIEKIKKDYTELDNTLEYVQRIAKYNTRLEDDDFNVISEKLNFIQQRLKIIASKEQKVFYNIVNND
jgi:hypothetical protein